MQNHLGFDGFIQIALVVRDVEKAARDWAELFNVPVPEIRDHSNHNNPNVTYRGKVADYGMRMAVIRAGNWVIELSQPLGGESTFQEFLDKHGEGVHHLGFEVGEKRDAIVNELGENGYSMRQIGIYPGSSWTIVDSEDRLGVNLNIKPKR